MANEILEQIQNYLNLGWNIFPIKPNQKEPPLIKWRIESSNDPSQIKRWWAKWPDANIGLDCGKSGIVVIDVDKRNSGLSNWQAICEEHDIDTNTLQTITPSGGLHIFYKAPEGVKITNYSPWKDLGIDIRADGGYVLLPPSKTNYGDYKFHLEEINEPIPRAAPLPDILAELLNQKDQEITEAHNENDIIEEGDRDDTLTSLAGTMRSKGMTPEAIEAALLAENRNRCRIPLNDRQVKKIAASVSKYPPGKPKSKNKKGNETQAAKLIEFGCELILFHDENKEAMVFIEGEAVLLK